MENNNDITDILSTEPLVSVLIISYHHEKFIEECIITILNQSYNNIELKVVDNSENHICYDIIKSLQKKHRNFSAFKQENIGTIKTLNKYIPLFKGQYFFGISGDDYLPVNSIEHRVKFMEANPQYPMCFGRTISVDHNSKETGRNNNRKFHSGYIFNDVINSKYHPPAMTYFFRKSIFEEVGLYDERLFYVEDKYILFKISQHNQIGFIDEYVAYQRHHSSNLTNSIDYTKQLKEGNIILNEYKYLKDFRKIKRNSELSDFTFFVSSKSPLARKFFFKAARLFYRKAFIKSIIRWIIY